MGKFVLINEKTRKYDQKAEHVGSRIESDFTKNLLKSKF